MPQPVCVICQKPIREGEDVHFVKIKRVRYVHADCYKKERSQ